MEADLHFESKRPDPFDLPQRGLTPLICQITGGKTSREIAEQMLINSMGGVVSGGILGNRVNPIGLARAAEILLKNGVKVRP